MNEDRSSTWLDEMTELNSHFQETPALKLSKRGHDITTQYPVVISLSI